MSITTHRLASPTTQASDEDCAWTPDHVTRSLLGWGVVAGPAYVLVSLAQALTREGFDLTRHQWSLLQNGDLGWIQVTNFVLTGLMVIAFAVGLRRALRTGRASRWAPRLVGVFGAGMIAAGVFRADPALGFPVGTPEGMPEVTVAGILHFAAAGVGFLAVAVACLILARRQRADGQRGLATFSRVTGVGFLGGFLCVASGAGSTVANLLFTATVILLYTWISVVAVRSYRALSN